jgi:hypothetical protein
MAESSHVGLHALPAIAPAIVHNIHTPNMDDIDMWSDDDEEAGVDYGIQYPNHSVSDEGHTSIESVSWPGEDSSIDSMSTGLMAFASPDASLNTSTSVSSDNSELLGGRRRRSSSRSRSVRRTRKKRTKRSTRTTRKKRRASPSSRKKRVRFSTRSVKKRRKPLRIIQRR